MFPYGMPETTTSEYPATTPGIPAANGFTTTTTNLIQDPIVPSTLQMGTPISQQDLQYTLPSTDIQYGENLTTTSAYPATNYEYTNAATTTTSAYPATNYEYASAASTVDYQAPTTQVNYSTGYQAATAPVQYKQVKTIKYVPVTRIKHVPMVRTRYVPVPVNSSTAQSTLANQSLAQPPLPTPIPTPYAQQSLMAPPSTPLTASTAPVQPLFNPQPPVAVPTMQSMVTPANDSHYVSNYPIYENDARRVGLGITRRGSEFDALNRGNYGYNSVPGIGLTTAGGNLDDFALRSRALGLNGLNTTGLNTGIGSLHTGLGGLNTGVGSLNTGLGGLNTGLGGINTGLGSLNTGLGGINTGLNSLNTGLGNLNTGLNKLGTGVGTAGLSNLGSGLNNFGSGLNNLGSGVGNTGLSNLGSGLNNIGTGLNNLNNLSTGLNNVTSSSTGLGSLNNLTEGINNFNGLSGNGNLTFADNLRSGFNNAVNNTNSELNNLTNNVNDATNNLVSSTKEGLNNASSGVKNLFN